MCLTSSIVIMTVSCCADILPSNLKVFGLTYVGRTWTSFFSCCLSVWLEKKHLGQNFFLHNFSYCPIEQNLFKVAINPENKEIHLIISLHSNTFINGSLMSLSLQSEEFKFNRPQFLQKAKEWTQKYATGHKISAAASVKVVNTAVVQQLVLLTEFVYIWFCYQTLPSPLKWNE